MKTALVTISLSSNDTVVQEHMVHVFTACINWVHIVCDGEFSAIHRSNCMYKL